MRHSLTTSTGFRLASALTAVGLVVAGCGTDPGGASPSSSSSAAAQSSVPRTAPSGGADSQAAGAKAASLAAAVNFDGAMAHLQQFQDIANRNGGNRALGTPGYEQSIEYAEKVLREAGFSPQRQEFEAARWESTKAQAQVAGSELPVMALQFSGGTASAGVAGKAAVTGTTGCSAGDLQKVAAGSIAVVVRGSCTFGDKYKAAAAAGAAALIVLNNEPGEWQGATLGLEEGATIPVVGAAQGAPISEGDEVRLTVDASTTKTKSWNLLAETKRGDDSAVQMVGAHLDSVAEGPGINDNASGSAAVLETAATLGANADVKNKVRFALWGAEEEGLIGSTRYVTSLSETESKNIARYLNFDMLASPNGGYFTYDGDGSSKLEGGAGPAGSGVIEQVFRNYFASRNVHVEASAFDGRSDYGPFTEIGVASGGMDTGADGKKSEEQQRHWGGTVGEQFDQNYHTPRDDLSNLNRDMYRVAIGAVAWATAYFAAL